MGKLNYKDLLTLELTVDFAAVKNIGKTANGVRRIVPITGGRFFGERLNGKVLSGADWVLNRHDGVMVIDVRLILLTENGANIYLTYQGRFLASSGAMNRFLQGEVLDKVDYSLDISARFECGNPAYEWLNDVIAVGNGEQTKSGPIYQIFEIG